MGGCCVAKNPLFKDSELNVFEKKNDIEVLKNIKSAFDSRQTFEYLLSENYYDLFFQGTKHYDIIEKLTEKLSNNEILNSIKKILDWIQELDTTKIYQIDIDTINKIDLIKLNANLNTKKIMEDIINYAFQEDTETDLVKSLSFFSILLQLINYLIHSGDVDIYKNKNFWKDKNIEEESKKLIFQGTFGLLKIKNKYSKNNEILITNSNEHRDDKKETVSEVYQNIDVFLNNLNK